MTTENQTEELNELGQTFAEAVEAVEPQNVLATIKVSQLIDVSSWREKQEKLVQDNAFFEIVDNKTYESGKVKRTNVVKGRTELEKQDKLVASSFASIRKEVGTETASLITISKPLEDKWQVAVKAWEDRKAREKEEAAKAEELRINTIKDKIEEIETACFEIVQTMVYGGMNYALTLIDAFYAIEFDFEEYDILLDQVKERITTAYENKVKSLTESENQRLENVRLEAEAKEVNDRIELQNQRLNEILPYVAFGEAVDLTKLCYMELEVYDFILRAKKTLFDADLKSKQDAEAEALVKLEEEKEAIYEIRKKRLEDLGMQYSDEHDTLWLEENADYILLKDDVADWSALEFEQTFSEVKGIIESAKEKVEKEKVFDIRKNRMVEIGFTFEEKVEVFLHLNLFSGISKESISECDTIDFETIITDAKLAIEKAKSDFEEAEKQKVIDEELAIADAEKLKKQRKAIVKKYVSDKKALTDFVDSLEFGMEFPILENEASIELCDSFNGHVQDLKKQLLITIENL